LGKYSPTAKLKILKRTKFKNIKNRYAIISEHYKPSTKNRKQNYYEWMSKSLKGGFSEELTAKQKTLLREFPESFENNSSNIFLFFPFTNGNVPKNDCA